MVHYEDIFDDGGRIICILCSVVLPDDNVCIEAHINEENHKTLYFNRLLIRNNMKLNGNFVKCLMCANENIHDSFEHVKQHPHNVLMVKIKNIVEKDGGFIELPENEIENKLNCLICNREVGFTLDEIEGHFSSSTHMIARSIALQPFNGIISVENNEKDLWCKICKVYIPNYIESIFNHVDNDEDHVTALTKLLRQIEGQNITIEKFLANSKEDKALCNKCDREVSCNIINIDSHVRGGLLKSKP